MKKFLTITMTLFLIFSATACQQSERTKKQQNDTPDSHQQYPATPSDQTQKGDKNGIY